MPTSYQQVIRNICSTFDQDIRDAKRVSDSYRVRNQIIITVKMEMRDNYRNVPTADWMYEIAKYLGVTSQTLYRSRAAIRAFINGSGPSKYAEYSFNKIIRENK